MTEPGKWSSSAITLFLFTRINFSRGDVNGVEDVLANVEESIMDAAEINEAISQPIQGMLNDNDDDIEREYLELLEQQEEDNDIIEEERKFCFFSHFLYFSFFKMCHSF